MIIDYFLRRKIRRAAAPKPASAMLLGSGIMPPAGDRLNPVRPLPPNRFQDGAGTGLPPPAVPVATAETPKNPLEVPKFPVSQFGLKVAPKLADQPATS